MSEPDILSEVHPVADLAPISAIRNQQHPTVNTI